MKQEESTLGIVITTTAMKTTTSTRLLGIRFFVIVRQCTRVRFRVCVMILLVYLSTSQHVISDDNIHKYIHLTWDLFASPYSLSTYYVYVELHFVS